MLKIIKLFLILLTFSLISACNSIENGLTNMFEAINNTDPLPKDYAQKANEEYGSSQSYQKELKQMNNNTNLNPNMTFEDWHNNQYSK